MLNPYFHKPVHSVDSERSLMHDLTRECIQIYGQHVYYIPRELGREDKILGEDTLSIFKTAIPIEMYVKHPSHTGDYAKNDLMNKFGLEITDQYTFIVERQRFKETIGDVGVTIVPGRPNEGDLLWFDFDNPDEPNTELYEIIHVEHEQPHYQLANLTCFEMKCEKFKYSNEIFRTGISEIDNYGKTVGVNSIYARIQQEDSSEIILENGTGFVMMDTPWHNEVQPTRTYGNNDQFQKEALEVVEFSVENPFGEF